MDAGAFLNWRSDHQVSALEMTPTTSTGALVTSEKRDLAGPNHGVVDLRELQSTGYRIRARTPDGLQPVTLLAQKHRAVTRNEGWVEGARWVLEDDESGPVALRREPSEEMLPQVLSVGCALGVVSLTVGHVLGNDWVVELRQRKSERTLTCENAEDTPNGMGTFRFSARHWDETGLPPDGEITRWDAWAVRRSSRLSEVRLKWGGSSAADPRASQRLRASVSCPRAGSATRVRPYWTLDQYLSVEISRFIDLEGMQA